MWKVLPNCAVDKIWLLKRGSTWHCYPRYMPAGSFSWRVDESPIGEFTLLETALQYCREQWPNHHPTVRHDGLFQDPVPVGQYSFGAFLGDLRYRT